MTGQQSRLPYVQIEEAGGSLGEGLNAQPGQRNLHKPGENGGGLATNRPHEAMIKG